ncbi:DUF1330 domain-containing protein [Streptomyces chrestomyceticus]|uniref:DUF1330 domain-containing protein n=1 Tax=Streptomyces chrestomyceticus TaxID=68185 RepID=UPI00340F7E92
MPAYAFAHLRDRKPHPEVYTYLERIQATLTPYLGRFLAHGDTLEVREGEWPGSLVLLEFPGLAEARAWYDSDAYQEILPLRTRHIAGDVILFPGLPADYDPTTRAEALKAAETPAPAQ